MAIYFHRITIFALPVNCSSCRCSLVLMPAALLTLLALVASGLRPPLLPAMIVALVLHFGVGLVHLFGSLALGDFRIPAPLLWQSVAFCALLGGGHRAGRMALAPRHESRWPRRAGLGGSAAGRVGCRSAAAQSITRATRC